MRDMHPTPHASAAVVVVVLYVFMSLLTGCADSAGALEIAEPPPSPVVITPLPAGPPRLDLDDPPRASNAIVKVRGVNWPPGRVVFIYLTDPATGEQVAFSAQVDMSGEFKADVPHPADPRWAALDRIDVIAQTADRSVEVVRRFRFAGTMAQLVETATPAPPSAPTPAPTSVSVGAPLPARQSAPTPILVPPRMDPGQWRAEYFDNPNLADPVILLRGEGPTDALPLHLEWPASPGVGLPADGFSVRLSHRIHLPRGTHRFAIKASGGVRVYVDDTVIFNAWQATQVDDRVDAHIVTGGEHTVRIDLVDRNGRSAIEFSILPVPDYGSAWYGEYFNNPDLGGDPVAARNDGVLNFEWGEGSPGLGLPANDFSARWTRDIVFPAGVTHFRVRADDGVRLRIDDVLEIDEWHESAAVEYARDVALAEGAHRVVVEYFERGGRASVAFCHEPITFAHWKGEYFNNKELAGLPMMVRDDKHDAFEGLDFYWGEGAPEPGLPANDFSARWTRTLEFDRIGVYRFSLTADDGVKLYVDGALVRDEWHASNSVTYSILVDVRNRQVPIRIEYKEESGNARISVRWEWVSDLVPTDGPPTPTPAPGPTRMPAPTGTPTCECFTPTP